MPFSRKSAAFAAPRPWAGGIQTLDKAPILDFPFFPETEAVRRRHRGQNRQGLSRNITDDYTK